MEVELLSDFNGVLGVEEYGWSIEIVCVPV